MKTVYEKTKAKKGYQSDSGEYREGKYEKNEERLD